MAPTPCDLSSHEAERAKFTHKKYTITKYQILCVVRAHVAIHIPQVMGGVHLHVRKCRCPPVFRISGMAGRIALKSGVWLETH